MSIEFIGFITNNNSSETIVRSGPVLDPILSIRRRVRLEPGESAVVAFTTAVADSREEALTLADQYHNGSAVARAFELAWAHSLIEHRHRSWSPQEIHLFQRLASHIIYAGSALRAAPAVVAANRQGPSDLWRHGISGDRPIVLARIAGGSETGLARQLLSLGSNHELLVLNDVICFFPRKASAAMPAPVEAGP